MNIAVDKFRWTPELIEQLIALAGDGKSSSAIARKIGEGCTRNAVCGKIFRLEKVGALYDRPHVPRGQSKKAAAKTTAPYLSKKNERPAKPAKTRVVKDVALGDVHFTKRGRSYNRSGTGNPIIREIKEPAPFTNGERIGLLQLTSQTCKWPIGDPLSKDFCFCGHVPREASPYCEYHARAAYQPLQDRRQQSSAMSK
jgi:GcrA cell cycle regulator